jgi:hypothetical protein
MVAAKRPEFDTSLFLPSRFSCTTAIFIVGDAGFEPATPSLCKGELVLSQMFVVIQISLQTGGFTLSSRYLRSQLLV